MVEDDSSDEVFACAVDEDLGGDPEQFLTDELRVFGFEFLLNSVGLLPRLLHSWDDDGGGGCSSELCKFAE